MGYMGILSIDGAEIIETKESGKRSLLDILHNYRLFKGKTFILNEKTVKETSEEYLHLELMKVSCDMEKIEETLRLPESDVKEKLAKELEEYKKQELRLKEQRESLKAFLKQFVGKKAQFRCFNHTLTVTAGKTYKFKTHETYALGKLMGYEPLSLEFDSETDDLEELKRSLSFLPKEKNFPQWQAKVKKLILSARKLKIEASY